QHAERLQERGSPRNHILIPYAADSGTAKLSHRLVSLVRKHPVDETAHDAPRNSGVSSARGVAQVDHQCFYIDKLCKGLVKGPHEFLLAERVVDAHVSHVADNAIREH